MAYDANTNWSNEEAYLNGLISKGGGNAEWAKNQLNELNAAKQQYGGSAGQTPGTPDTTANRYFPTAGSSGDVPSGYQAGTDLAAGTTTAPNGDTLSLHDWSTDKTDYGAQMLGAKTLDEFLSAARSRENKANAQGLDIVSGAGGIRSNEDLYNEWRRQTGFQPNYGEFLTPGQGWDSVQGKEGYINNAGLARGYYGMDSEGHWGYFADAGLTQKLDNGTWDKYASSDGGYVRMDERGQPSMTEQDLSRAGQTVILTSPKGTWRVTYGANGYPVASVRTSDSYTPGLTAAKADSSAGVSSEDLLRQQFGGRSYTGPGSGIDQNDVTAAARDDYLAALAGRTQAPGPSLPTGAIGSAGGTLPGGTTGAAGTTGTTGSSGTGGVSGSGYDLSEWLKQQYESALESELAGLKDAYEKNTASLDDEEARLSGIYDPQRNRVAAQNALSKRAWDERAEANGLSSGANGQAELARSSVLARDLASIGEEEANARADVSLRKKNLTIEYTNAIAQAKANGQAELAQALYNELVRVQGLEREDQIRESETALKQAQAQMEYELALKQMEADSASQETAKPTLTASQAYTAYKNGIRTNEVLTAMQYYYGIGGNSSGGTGGSVSGTRSSGSSGGSGSGKQSTGSAAASGSSASGGYNASSFNAAMSSLRTMLAQGKTDYAVGGIDSFWGKLSDEQKERVRKLLKEYGLTYMEG